MPCRGDGVSEKVPPCSSVPPARVGGSGGAWGAWEGFPNHPDRVKFLHISPSQQPGEPPLSTPFEADVFFGLSPLVSFSFLRSLQMSGRLGWGPGHCTPAPRAQRSRWELGAALVQAAVWLPEAPRVHHPGQEEGGGRWGTYCAQAEKSSLQGLCRSFSSVWETRSRPTWAMKTGDWREEKRWSVRGRWSSPPTHPWPLQPAQCPMVQGGGWAGRWGRGQT